MPKQLPDWAKGRICLFLVAVHHTFTRSQCRFGPFLHSLFYKPVQILELCHCIQESQDNQLAKWFVATRPTLELRNIPLSPNDIHALTFIVSSVGDNGIGLDFGACSMEPECLDVLCKCRYINCLRLVDSFTHAKQYRCTHSPSVH